MAFELTHDLLLAICGRNFFPLPKEGMVFFGLRGCLPMDPEDYSFAASRCLQVAEVNYVNPRCTIGQWLPAKKRLAVYPGSTCPNRDCVRGARGRGGEGANQLLTGYYTFVKGMHKVGKPSGHQAFRQEELRVVLRNVDDMDFDFEDRPDPGNQADNLHCGFCASLNRGYSSAGCQVVAGFPNTNDGRTRESGPWAYFRQTAYALNQASFRYLLVRGAEAEAMSQDLKLKRPALIRFGSKGEEVRSAQKKMRELGLINFVPDADCGPLMQMGIIKFQIQRMGAQNADGILGPNTAAQLGLTKWPMIGTKKPRGVDGREIKLRSVRAGGGVKPKGARKFQFAGDYKLPRYAIAEFSAAAGVPWDGALAIPDWNEYKGCVQNSGYEFPYASVPALFYEAKFAIDADGTAPAAGLDKTGQFNTSLHDRNNAPLNSDRFPFIVLPLNQQKDRFGAVLRIGGRTLAQMGAQLGDLGVVIYKTGKIVPVLYGDRGPALFLGEGSMMVARALGINDDPNRGGIDKNQIPPGIVHLVFPGTNDAPHNITQRGPEEVARGALRLFDRFRARTAQAPRRRVRRRRKLEVPA
jgi:peptidoglycan hydrolase-like protein with peptidoglycan-binding domain